MPNWAYSKVTILGRNEEVEKLKAQLSQPYQSPLSDDRTITGDFLLWNIVKPTNLRAYTGEEQAEFEEIVKNNPDLAELNKPVTPQELMDKVLHEIATSDSWYEWNVRNWGTKWELSSEGALSGEHYEALTEVEAVEPNSPIKANLTLEYRLSSAWSPPVEALSALHEQYPSVWISLSSIDESDNFAMEAHWFQIPVAPNEFMSRYNEQDIEITHELGMELRGYCNLECCNDWGDDE